ncbi:MAG: 4Fe-4S dicluster domain-containing protein [Thermoanaerobaculia bacterium]
MRYGFALDQAACIGCHACTVACKAENDVPLGSFRTWVKWIEHGSFPDTRRSAAVLRCNHCADAPCITICPTRALHKRPDGIVDLDRDRCIGCASCIQACPYDALHIDDRHGTAAKCHLCAHRLDVGLAPACVSVCPEEAIHVIDLDDPETRAALAARRATVRKPERRTRPQTFYLDADPAALDPLAVDGTRTLSHAEVPDPLPAPGTLAARAVYDVPRERYWGGRIAAYMVTKAAASGALLAACLSPWLPALHPVLLGWLSLVMTTVTCVLLISDLHKPARFFYLLTRPNPGSWLVRGGWILAAHALLSLPWALGLGGAPWSVPGVPVALATSVYTAFLFRQARGRELWSEDRLLPATLTVQSIAAAAGLAWLFGISAPLAVGLYLVVGMLALVVPLPTAHARQAHRLMVRRPSFVGGLAAAGAAILWPPLVFLAMALLDWAYIRAGQEVPLS